MTKPEAPIAAQKPFSASIHGITREDPYHWLRAENWQAVMRDPEVLDTEIRDYLEAENAYFEEQFGKPSAALQEAIYTEIRGRIKEDDSGIPSPHGPYAYNSRMLKDQQYPLLVRTPREGGDETVLLDCNAEAGDGYFGLGGAAHDPTHRYLAWSADRNGSEYYTIRIRDLSTGRELEDVIEGTSGGAVWDNKGEVIFYTLVDDNHRPYRIMRHRLGTPVSEDALVYEEKDSGFFIGAGKTLSHRFIVVNAHDHETSEWYLIDADAPESAPQLVSARQTGREYAINERGGLLYILTNAGDAEDFKIVTAPADNPGEENWTDLVPHREGVLVLDFALLADHMIRLERVAGLPRIVIRDLNTGDEKEVSFDEEAYALGMSTGYEFDTATFRFTYSSPTTPSETYDYDAATGERTFLKRREVPSGHNPQDYVTHRLMAKAPDGEDVPVTILHRADLTPGADTPCLLYGYGAYGHSIPAGFGISQLSLVDRGFVYAIAHIRGGKDKGFRWYRDGKKDKKTNTFTDFIAAAEMLVAKGLTGKGRIVAQGGSAGGMLMGAIANQRPDLFAGIIAQVPFVDVLNTMLDETLPLTPPEWPEWGNPITSEVDYATIAAYSPYDNVSAQDYPAMLVEAGLTDPRVTYWEPAKWVAKLRATKTDTNPLYLKTNMGAGHAGASGRFDAIKETARAYAFAVAATGTEKLS
ncbi:S9 family peptidase [Cucumibacter marinus]|uniref:S9 family peptidase n=1 Tax=Cucumibacter marinus TaxID=1121252 RepID=UPI0003FEE6CB|nr:S9 family peptidase [Cucumibacter marinus]